MPEENESSKANALSQYQLLLDQRKASQEALDAAKKDSTDKEKGFLMGSLDPSMEKGHKIWMQSLRKRDACQRNLNNLDAIILKFEKENPAIVTLYRTSKSSGQAPSPSTTSQPQQQVATTTLSSQPSPPITPRTRVGDQRRQAQMFSKQYGGDVTSAPSVDPRNLQASPQRPARTPSPPAPVNTEVTMTRTRAGAISTPQSSPPSSTASTPVSTPRAGDTLSTQHSTTSHVMEELTQGQKNVDPMQLRLQSVQSSMNLLRERINACEARVEAARKDGSYLSPQYIEQFNLDKKEISRLARSVRTGLRHELDNIVFHTRDKTINTLPEDYVSHVKALQGVYDSLMLSMHKMETPIWEARLNALKENYNFKTLQSHFDKAVDEVVKLGEKQNPTSNDQELVTDMIKSCEQQLQVVQKEVNAFLMQMEVTNTSAKEIMDRYKPRMDYEKSTPAKINNELSKLRGECEKMRRDIQVMSDAVDEVMADKKNSSPASSPRGTNPS